MPLFSRKAQERYDGQANDTDIARQIENLVNQSDNKRDEVFGQDWSEQVEKFYNITGSKDQAVWYSPEIKIPKLQHRLLSEASDLSENSPRIYITSKTQRDKDRENAFRAAWYDLDMNLKILLANIWSLFYSVGYIQTGYDPLAERGKGSIWTKVRNPATVHPDPNNPSSEWSFVCVDDYFYIDEIRRRWPEKGIYVKQKGAGSPEKLGGVSSLKMPSGPMSVTGLRSGTSHDDTGGQMRVRTLWTADYSVMDVPEGEDFQKGLLAHPEVELMYPDGRMVTECEGVILYDGRNPYPRGIKPITQFCGLPPLTGSFPPPSSRFSSGLQDLAEKMFTQTYENAVRLNNAVWFIGNDTGIEIDDFGGIPAEAQMINAGSKAPEMRVPPPFPPQMVDLPMKLFEMQDDVQGFSQNRQGKSPTGNVSAPLMDAAISQSQSITRLRSKLLAKSTKTVAEHMFYIMAEFYKTDRDFPSFDGKEELEFLKWIPIDSEEAQDYTVHLDPGSVKPMSGASLRNLVPVMKQMGLIDAQTALEWLEVPNATEILGRLEKEAQTRALAMAASKGGKKK